jgi:hypothetical protein
MREIEVEGTFYDTRGWSKRAVIYVDPPDDVALNDWRNENKLYTNWLERPHPCFGKQVPVLYPSPTFASRFNDGDAACVKLAVRTDSKGNGMKFVDAFRRSGKRTEPTQPTARPAAPVASVSRVAKTTSAQPSKRTKRTPELPAFIRDFRPADCPHKHPWCLASKNVYELVTNESKLFGTERMVDASGREISQWAFGDWNCEMLLLMQDAAAVDGIAARVGKHPDPFSARNFWDEPSAGGAATNRNLYNLAANIQCRKLVGSALIGILKPGANYSGPIRECSYVRDHCLHTLAWAMEAKQTPNLRTVVCLGTKASDFVSDLINRGLVDASRFRVAQLPHPSRYPAGGIPVATAAWRRMATESGFAIH